MIVTPSQVKQIYNEQKPILPLPYHWWKLDEPATYLEGIGIADDGRTNCGRYIDMCVTDDGHPILAYSRNNSGDTGQELIVSTYNPDTNEWDAEVLVELASINIRDIGIGKVSSGDLFVVYAPDDATYITLSIIWQTNGVWGSPSVIDDAANKVGTENSVQVDSSDNIHISYYDTTNTNLKYTKGTLGGSWSTETISHPSPSVGNGTALILNESQNPVIFFRNQSLADLDRVEWTGSSWSRTAQVAGIGSGYDEGLHPAAGHDADGHEIIAARLMTNGLVIARHNGTSWTRYNVETSDCSAAYMCVGLYGDIPVVGYYNDYWSKRDIRYAVWNGSSWDVNIVEGTGSGSYVGKYTAIGPKADGKLLITYWHETNDQLKCVSVPVGSDEIAVDSGSEEIDGERINCRTGRQGYKGNCYVFNGIDSRIFLGAATPPLNGVGTFTAWVKIPAGSTGYLIEMEEDAADYFQVLFHGSGNTYMGWQQSSSDKRLNLSGGNAKYADGNWHMMAFTWGPSGTTAYIDDAQYLGNNVTAVPAFTSFVPAAATNFMCAYTATSGVLKAQVQDVRMYDKILTTSQIRDIYNGTEKYD